MKSTVILYIGLIMMILEIAILANSIAKSAYADSIRQSLDDSLERSMSLIRMDADDHFALYKEGVGGALSDTWSDTYGTVTYDGATGLSQFKQDFVSIFAQNLDPKIDDLTINIFGADEERGLLSVEVIADFTYLGGNKGQVDTFKTMILNKTVKDRKDPSNGSVPGT